MNFGVYGYQFSDFNNYVDTSNTVDGKPIYYLIGVTDAVYDAKTNAGTIYLINCNNVTIRDLTLTRNRYGVFFWNTTNSKIEKVTASNNFYGIYLEYSINNTLSCNTVSKHYYGISVWRSYGNVLSCNTASNNNCGIGLFSSSSSNNILSGNTVSNSDYGIYLGYSGNNTFFHNNLINNRVQAYVTFGYVNTWDNGYPSGGNYWSDYAALDEKSGPNQDQLGSDGIGDTPYVINGNNQDNYPLMATPEAIDYVIQGLPSSEFDKPEEDIEDIKSDFMEKLADVQETIKEGNFERAIEHLQETRNFTYDQIIDTTKREEIIAMVDSLIAYLENFL